MFFHCREQNAACCPARMNSDCLFTPRTHLNVHSSQRAWGSLMLKDAIYREAISLYSQGSCSALYLWKLSVCLSQSATIWTKPTHTEWTPCPQRHFIKSKLDWKNDRLKCISNRLLSGLLPVKQRGLKSHSDTWISLVFPAAWKQKTIVDAWGKRIFKQRHSQSSTTAWRDRTDAAGHICKETLCALRQRKRKHASSVIVHCNFVLANADFVL